MDGSGQSYNIFSYRSPANLKPFSAIHPQTLVNCSKSQFCLYYVTPTFSMPK